MILILTKDHHVRLYHIYIFKISKKHIFYFTATVGLLPKADWIQFHELLTKVVEFPNSLVWNLTEKSKVVTEKIKGFTDYWVKSLAKNWVWYNVSISFHVLLFQVGPQLLFSICMEINFHMMKFEKLSFSGTTG